MREASANGNWKGGISRIRDANEILDLEPWARELVLQKFLENIGTDLTTECMNWIGSTFQQTGRACYSSLHRITAAKVSYVLFCGRIPPNLYVLHTCDNVLCVNPQHLWLGTPAQNSADMVAKGRSLEQTGSLNHAAKLDEMKVKTIKKLLKAKKRQDEIARMFGVCKQTITLIKQNKIWTHVQW